MDFQNKKFTKEEIEQYRDSFVDADLSGADLEGADLEGANLEGANLEGAKLEGANLEKANLTYANLTDAHLTRANLTKAHLKSAYLERADLKEAKLEGANLERANLSEANLSGANLEKANLMLANLEGANLTGSVLKGAVLKGTNLNRVDLSGANLTRLRSSTIIGVPLHLPEKWLLIKGYLVGPGADLSGADLSGAKLVGAYLIQANLEGANLEGANLEGSNLTGAYLQRANLTRANLTRANLTRANLTKANLTGANLEGANLDSANLTGANLTGANLTVQNKEILMKQLDNFNVNKGDPPYEKLLKNIEKQPTCWDVGQQTDYNINHFLLGKLEDDTTDEVEISRRLVFFVGQDRDNLQPYCYDLENLLADLNASIYTTDCTTYPRQLYKPLFKLPLGVGQIYVYLSDMIDVLTTTDKRVFVILPRLIDGKQEEIMKTGSYNAFFVPNSNWVGADHCQEGTNKKVYNIFACEGRDGDPCYPIEQA